MFLLFPQCKSCAQFLLALWNVRTIIICRIFFSTCEWSMNLAYFGSIERKRWRLRDESIHTHTYKYTNQMLCYLGWVRESQRAWLMLESSGFECDLTSSIFIRLQWNDVIFFACSHIIEFQWADSLSKIDEMMTLQTWRHWWLLLKWMLNQLTLKWFPAKWNQMIWFWSVNVRRLYVIGIVKWLKRKKMIFVFHFAEE